MKPSEATAVRIAELEERLEAYSPARIKSEVAQLKELEAEQSRREQEELDVALAEVADAAADYYELRDARVGALRLFVSAHEASADAWARYSEAWSRAYALAARHGRDANVPARVPDGGLLVCSDPELRKLNERLHRCLSGDLSRW